MRNEAVALREQIDRESMFEDIVGSSEALRKVLRQVARVAPSDSTVLILGETGTGKELIARAIHKRSTRADRAFIGVNCAANTNFADCFRALWSREGGLHRRGATAPGTF
jgi:formate hydrogenlyase transcriptional activator